MEVAVIIGMILAFLLGAYVREPFLFAKKEEEKEEALLPAPEEADGERKKTTTKNTACFHSNWNQAENL